MPDNTYPPKFDKNLKYPAIYNLDEIEVHPDHSNEPVGKWFNVTGLPIDVSYGKHAFYLSFNEPAGSIRLKENSSILFEFKDSEGTTILSDVTQLSDINGAAPAYVWIKEDPLRTYEYIANGSAILTIVGELEGVPSDWRGTYNFRCKYKFWLWIK